VFVCVCVVDNEKKLSAYINRVTRNYSLVLLVSLSKLSGVFMMCVCVLFFFRLLLRNIC
jgi:hypothetical protein